MVNTVPLIDIAPYRTGNMDNRRQVAAAIDQACCEIGFLVVEGHGVDDALINDMHQVSHACFARPFWEKMQFKMPPDRYRGYTPYVFFHQPNYDAVIECIPTCTSADNLPKYSRTTSGEHVTMRPLGLIAAILYAYVLCE